MKELPPHIFGLVRPLNEALLDRICDLKYRFHGTEEDPIPTDETGVITVPPDVLKNSLNSTVVAIINLIAANIVPPRPLEPQVSVCFPAPTNYQSVQADSSFTRMSSSRVVGVGYRTWSSRYDRDCSIRLPYIDWTHTSKFEYTH